MKKLEGVEDADVRLNDGTVALKLKPGNKITVEQVRDVIRKNGFTPKAALVEVAGRIIERNAKPALQVAGIDQVLLLAGHDAEATAHHGKEVLVTGTLPDGGSLNDPPSLTVSTIRAARKLH